jgi:hypothetical protein
MEKFSVKSLTNNVKYVKIFINKSCVDCLNDIFSAFTVQYITYIGTVVAVIVRFGLLSMKSFVLILFAAVMLFSFVFAGVSATQERESPAISDALEILKYLAKLPSEYDGTGLTPDISHALNILKYLAKLEPMVNWVRPSVTTTGGTSEPATTPPTTHVTTTTEEVTTTTETPTEPSEPSETTVATPRFPPLEPLSEEMVLRIKQDWLDYENNIIALGNYNFNLEIEPIQFEEVRFLGYFGTYNGSIVITMRASEAFFENFWRVRFYEKGYVIQSARPLYVWNDGIVYDMVYAQLFNVTPLRYRDFLTEQDIEEIFYHYPLNQDLYLSSW